MSDNLLLKGKNSKCRRGARAIKKNAELTINDVSNIFASKLNFSTEPQTTKQETVSVQTGEIVSVQNQEIDSVQTQKIVSIETPETISTETVPVQIIQNVISPQEQEEILPKKRKRRGRTGKKKDRVSTDIACEESGSVQGTKNKVVEIKKHSTKTSTRTKPETEFKLGKKSKSNAKSKSDNEAKESSGSDKEKKKSENEKFPPSMCEKEVRKLLEKQPKDNPTYVEGNLRINIKFSKHAYLAMPGTEMDILIVGARDRNRALEGDLVVVCIHPEDKWFKHTTEEVQKTGVVVCILEKVHPRKTIGYIKYQPNGILFYPRDSRIPLLRIVNPQSLPVTFYHNPDAFKDILFLADIVFWKKPGYALGKLQQVVGNSGELRVETNAILFENDLDIDPFEENLLQDLPPIDYIPTVSDLEGREDWRSRCIFTIDPATAVDLDDAVSCKLLENGNYEVSVHISDVTHYLKAFTPLDKKVSDRATTVYLVDNVYHMLPKQLCEVCSLLPGQDKLAFSVILEMSPTAKVIHHRFAKTVINSCCQLTYDQAQAMIENPLNDWSKDPTLNIKGNFNASHLCKTVNNLYKLSLQMRERRFASGGALRIDQPKLYISLDRETGFPVSCSIEEQKESNRLIEEFMLLANIIVAKQLYATIPETAFLRSHKEPSLRVLTQTRDMLEKFGVILNIESAGTLQMSLNQYEFEVTAESTENFAAKCRMMVINSLCARSMTRAVYRCSNSVVEDSLRHYALNVPFYTHFTSPIRRYSDCIVHRLLYASIRNEPLPPTWNSFLCSKLASNCNVKKYAAKVAQEQSSELFFTYLLDLKGPTNTQAVVMDVKNRSIDVIIIDVGLKVRIYFSDMEEEVTAAFSLEHSVPTIKLTWKGSELKQMINVFSIVDVRIQKHPSLFRLHGVLLPPFPNIMKEILKQEEHSSQEGS